MTRLQVSFEAMLAMSLAMVIALSVVFLLAHIGASSSAYQTVLQNYSSAAANYTGRLMQQCGCFVKGI